LKLQVNPIKMNFAVIGAGISGCSCAHQLFEAGHQVTVVEKGRGVGGRMATRRMDGARIDHGAQFYTARDVRLQALNEQWCREKRAIEWYDQVPGRSDIPTDMRYRGKTGMTGPAKSLTQGCKLALNFFVEKIERTKGWKILEREGGGRVLEVDHLVITMPSLQMLELFDRSGVELGAASMDRLKSIRHTRCLAILGILDRPSKLIHPGAVTHPAKNIDWLSDNQVKGISQRPAITLHTSAELSQTNWEVPAEEWAPELLASVEDQLGARLLSWVSHRWGFAKPLVTFGASHLHLPELGLTLAGDGFGGERVERASLSGLEAAGAILGTIF
jgi:predicted NAD/FAD-dependent oxidoreductase